MTSAADICVTMISDIPACVGQVLTTVCPMSGNACCQSAKRVTGCAGRSLRLFCHRIPPTLLPIATPHAISFRGAVGADHYRIERAETPNGPWTLVDGEVQDCQYPFYEPFDDKGAAMDRDIYYRVTAIGLGGESAPGNVMPFIAAHPLIADMEEEIIGDLFVDECNGLEKLYQIENPEHICVAKSGSYHQYSFNSFVFSGPVAMTYRSAIDMQDCFVHIGWQGEGWRALTLEVSRDGEHFVPAAASLRDYGECDGRHFGRLEAFPLPAGIRFLKIRVQPALELETLEVSRVEYTGGLVYED